MSVEPGVDIPDRALQSALEFAVGIAAAGAKLRPQLPFPAPLKKFLRFHKLPATALSQVRAAVEADDAFRNRLALVATTELIDDVGVLWLTRPEGWEQAARAALPASDVDDEAAIRREERRREAAQDAAARTRAELLALRAELDRERAAKAALEIEGDRLRVELEVLRQRLRDAQRAEHAAGQALAKVEQELAQARLAPAEQQPLAATINDELVRKLLAEAETASAEIGRLLGAASAAMTPDSVEPTVSPPRGRSRRAGPARKPIRLPGGVVSDSPDGVEFVLRYGGGLTLVDGYNVAKLGWPSLDLEQQRRQCLTAVENLAKRWNVPITVVFDGADIKGAHSPGRRRVRVVYSPAGVSADDVLREEVATADPARPIVVVTNDRAVIADVRSAGATVVSSDDLLFLLRR